MGPGCMSEFLPHLGNSRCLAATHHIFQKAPLPPPQKKMVLSSLYYWWQQTGRNFLVCIQNHLFFQTACVRICMPSVKNLVCKRILFVFCLEFKLQCGLILQIGMLCNLCKRKKRTTPRRHYLRPAIFSSLLCFNLL